MSSHSPFSRLVKRRKYATSVLAEWSALQNHLMTSSESGQMRVKSRGCRGHVQVLSWDRHREHILHLYETENRPLREVCDIMRQSHGFDAT